jgi:hypothetical protein
VSQEPTDDVVLALIRDAMLAVEHTRPCPGRQEALEQLFFAEGCALEAEGCAPEAGGRTPALNRAIEDAVDSLHRLRSDDPDQLTLIQLALRALQAAY